MMLLHTLSSLVFGELPGDFIEFGAVPELGQGFLFLAMLFAEDVAHVDAAGGFELAGRRIIGFVGRFVAFGF